jgi:hypothetical protein
MLSGAAFEWIFYTFDSSRLMKKILIVLLVFLCCRAFSQLGLKISHIRPTGSLGMVMKPAWGGELIYKPFEKESGLNLRIGVGFIKFAPRQDTFPTTTLMYNGGYSASSGYTVFHKFNITTITLGADYMIHATDAFRLYIGMDFGFLATSMKYESRTIVSSEGFSGGYGYICWRLRGGAEYLLTEKIGLFGEYNRSMNYSPEVGGLAYHDYALGMRINF